MTPAFVDHLQQLILLRIHSQPNTLAVVPRLPPESLFAALLPLLAAPLAAPPASSSHDSPVLCRLDSSKLNSLPAAQLRTLEAHEGIAALLASKAQWEQVQVEVVRSKRAGLLERLSQRQGDAADTQALIELMDSGQVRCAEKVRGVWQPQAWVIQGVLNYFATHEMQVMERAGWDKIPLKTQGWDAARFAAGGVRYAPGAVVRKGAWLGAGTVVMSHTFVNIGAWVGGEGVMLDTGSRVASAAQVGKGVKLGAGSGLEGVLEPAGRMPTIVEDQVRIGAMCEAAGIIEEGAVLASGVVMASGKKIYDEATGKLIPPLPLTVEGVTYQLPVIPAWRLAVGGALVSNNTATDAVILKPGDLRERGTLRHFERQGLLYSR